MSVYSVDMPDLGEGVLEGEIQKWLVEVGNSVTEDQVLLEVMTDKASVEIPSPVSGTVKELKVKEGESCAVGKPLLILETTQSKEEPKEESAKEHTQMSSQKISLEKQEVLKSSQIEKLDDSIQAVPAVRKKAQENNIDLKNVKGTGLAGRITMKDLEKHIPQERSTSTPASSGPSPSGFSIPTQPNQRRVPLKGIRKKIADTMSLSKAVIPHFTLMDQAQVEALYKLRSEAKELYPDVKITYLPFIIKVLQRCVQEFPEFNASIDSSTQEIVYKTDFNFGIATDTPQGLLVPVIKNIDQKNILELSNEIISLSEKARNSKISLDEMKNATLTLTNMGSIAGRWATPIINPPETCIVGIYRMFETPIWKGESFHPVRVMNFSLTCDHRLIDGARAARFMSKFIENIENPSLILIEG